MLSMIVTELETHIPNVNMKFLNLSFIKEFLFLYYGCLCSYIILEIVLYQFKRKI